MTGILVAPSMNTVLFERRGIFQMDASDATVACLCPQGLPCPGVDVNLLPHEEVMFQHLAMRMGKRFIERQLPRGFEFPHSGALRLHGPFPSYDFNNRLADVDANQLKQANLPDRNGDEHPELSLDFVFERPEVNPQVDYVFVGEFLFKDRMTDLEVPTS